MGLGRILSLPVCLVKLAVKVCGGEDALRSNEPSGSSGFSQGDECPRPIREAVCEVVTPGIIRSGDMLDMKRPEEGLRCSVIQPGNNGSSSL